MSKKLVNCSEVMTSSPTGYLKFPQAYEFSSGYRYGEANTTEPYAYLSMKAAYLKGFPDNIPKKRITQFSHKYWLSTKQIICANINS
ncbi:hypothetical protein JJL45_00430 [Tamlana sp. s12]|uniref:hypothetical protein n=1 Tax=Tamlana sp. s12 TaxID=1630406 RepID=UPI0007FE6AFD|nr:hypothetical protein [Tamlana sp. s12]OBQ57314.1 hypothetical protein VQ01_02235 [Tamlana sp. s12]QQY82493.1 hypothetical protein JJL45_00430 [Tamlana sp. s12]